MLKIEREDIGRFVRIKHDDIGTVDGILVALYDGAKPPIDVGVFQFFAGRVSRVSYEQIVELGDRAIPSFTKKEQ